MPFTAPLFDWQKPVVEWAIRKGRCALFEDCGLGKTVQQLEWAQQVVTHAGGMVLILCPLAVAAQTVREGLQFGIKVTQCKTQVDCQPGINITNYDRIEHFSPELFAGVVLDESSILKAFQGKLRNLLTAAFSKTPYRLCCTATPSPNDFTELGQQADFLGICKPSEMLATYFINDTFDTGTWRLKGHAEEAFWKWVSSWAVCISKPSDIGFSDEGYELPPLETHLVNVAVDHRADEGSGELFVNPTVSATQIHAHNRRTMQDRVAATAQIANQSSEAFVVWCEGNDESSALAAAIPDAVEIVGSDSAEFKEQSFDDFCTGKTRVIISKPKIAGLGLNFQHCRNEIYVGMTYSFERFYQSGKRLHRFGQKRKVNRYIVKTDAENGVQRAIDRKQEQHDQMRALMKFTRDELFKQQEPQKMNTQIETISGENWTMHHGDCVRVAKTFTDNSVGFSVFSPPFADLFTYSDDVQDMGNCAGLPEFMVQFGALVDELKRVLMPGREVAVHCCDLLATKWKDGEIEFKDFSGELIRAFRSRGFALHSRITIWKDPVTEMQRTKAHGLLYKTLRTDSSKSRVGAPDYLLVFRKPGENPVPIRHEPARAPVTSSPTRSRPAARRSSRSWWRSRWRSCSAVSRRRRS
ncbi:MAG: helicase [Verrucomicrobia bacterium]|nr:helicase [Verrucomicrobiota bacterium]